MTSTVEILNRALQKLGAKRITSLTDNSANARACNAAFEPIKLRLLRQHRWNFAIERASLAANATAPAWGRANSFPLPSDYLKILPPYPEDNLLDLDWIIERRSILTDDGAPLYIRYIKNVTDPNDMDPLFRELLSTVIAFELCEEITQSNTKKANLRTDVKDIIKDAKRSNAIENVAVKPPDDEWISIRD